MAQFVTLKPQVLLFHTVGDTPLLSDEAKRFIMDRTDEKHNGCVGVLASLRSDGTPNASPKFFRIRDDNHLEFADIFSTSLSELLEKSPDVTVVFFDSIAVIGIRIKGKATIENFGPFFDQAVDRLAKMGFKPRAIISIEIEEVQTLSFGPETGRKIG